jgi:hypothetical protein
MTEAPTSTLLEADLAELLAPGFPGIAIEVGENERWDRPCVTFRWTGFSELLPEERFHRLTGAIPEVFRSERLAGFIWLELAAGETVEAFLRLPRSEDVASREACVYEELLETGFFKVLGKSLGRSPKKNCGGGFSASAAALVECKRSPAQVQDTKLVFIRHGAYCDCQVLESIRPGLAELYAGAA